MGGRRRRCRGGGGTRGSVIRCDSHRDDRDDWYLAEVVCYNTMNDENCHSKTDVQLHVDVLRKIFSRS